MDHIYQDIEWVTGEKGVMTHMIPNACRAMEDYLREQVTEERFWDSKFDLNHIGEIELKPMNEDEREQFWERYQKLPHPFAQLGANHEG